MNRLNYAARPFLGCALLLATAALLQGCAGLDAANSIYNGARNWQNLSKSSAMLKDLTNAQPHFAGYNSVFVVADIAPRDNSAAVTQAWIGNMADYTQSVRVQCAPHSRYALSPPSARGRPSSFSSERKPTMRISSRSTPSARKSRARSSTSTSQTAASSERAGPSWPSLTPTWPSPSAPAS